MGPTLARLLDALDRRATWRNAALAVAGLIVSNLVLGAYILPNIEARRPEAVEDGFLVMLDLEPLRPVDEVYRILDLYTPDILGFVRLLYATDFLIPLLFAVLVFCLAGKMVRYLEVEGHWRAALLLPFAALPFDYAENALSLFLVSRYQHGQVFPALARLVGIVTAAKFLGLACIGLMMVALLIRTATTFVARSRAR